MITLPQAELLSGRACVCFSWTTFPELEGLPQSLNHLSFELWQYVVHGDATENHLKTLFSPEWSGLGS